MKLQSRILETEHLIEVPKGTDFEMPYGEAGAYYADLSKIKGIVEDVGRLCGTTFLVTDEFTHARETRLLKLLVKWKAKADKLNEERKDDDKIPEYIPKRKRGRAGAKSKKRKSKKKGTKK